MDTLNIVIMGKTGAGKSTLLNAIIEEDIAPTGSGGQAVTKENVIYSRKLLLPLGTEKDGGRYGLTGKQVNLYDTVGLEIDKSITHKRLKKHSSSLQRLVIMKKKLILPLFCFV